MFRAALTKKSKAFQGIIGKRFWHPPPSGYESQFGKDYPQFKWQPFDSRPADQHWDDPVHRRMFGETIPEEFDLQDAYFQGEHDPMGNLWAGLVGQAAVFGIALSFLGLAYITLNPDTKPAAREIPESVDEHMRTLGWDKVNKRPYEPVMLPPNYETVAADCGHTLSRSLNANHHDH